MKTIRLLILSQDKEYGYALGKAISNLHTGFQVTVGDMENMTTTSKITYDFLLTDSDMDLFIQDHTKTLSCSATIRLSDTMVPPLSKQFQNPIKECKTYQIYKYSRLSEIASDLKYICSILFGGKNIVRDSQAFKTTGFYSTTENVGKSVVSLSTARELSMYHDKKVLYVCFDEIPATLLYTGSRMTNKRNISDFLYYLLHKRDESVYSLLESFTFKDEYGVTAFHPSMGINELRQLTEEELIFFFRIINECSQFDHVIVDLASDMSKETFFLLNYCSKIVFIQTENLVSNYKSDLFLDYFSKVNKEKVESDFIYVINKCKPFNTYADYNYIEEIKGKPVVVIEEDESSFSCKDRSIDISINHVFGLGIKKIVDELLFDIKTG